MRFFTLSLLVTSVVSLACSEDDTSLLPHTPSCPVRDDDTNGDCLVDALGSYVDEDGDGIPDGEDTNGDRYVDIFAIDIDGDGIADGWAIDREGDRQFEGVDTDGDGVADYFGSGFEGVPDATTGEWYAPTIASIAPTLYDEYTRWFDRNYEDCGDGTAVIKKSTSNVVSEGIGYGMLITATLGTQAEFDTLYQFYIANLNSTGGLMGWDCPICGTCRDNAATDADLDAAMAMLQAEKRWSGGYRDSAVQVIQALRANFVIDCSGYTVLRAGEWARCAELNPSYFSPGYYRVFAEVDPEGATTWNQMIDDAYVLFDLSKDAHHEPNLLWPDGMRDDASSAVGSFANNGYDACRVPWRIATDYAWSGDERARVLLDWVGQQVDANGMEALSTDTNSAFYGGLSFAGMAGDQARAEALHSMWIESSLQDSSYYQGTLRLLYLLLAGGHFPRP